LNAADGIESVGNAQLAVLNVVDKGKLADAFRLFASGFEWRPQFIQYNPEIFRATK